MLDYEKAYKEAIEKLRILQRSWSATQNRAAKEIAEAFPELLENEDERIRREILETLHYGLACEESVLMPGATTTLKEAIAYLEKQKEQKPESCDCSRDEESYTNGIHHVLMNPEAYGLIKQKPVHTAKEMWKEMRLEVYAQASGNRHEPNYSDDSTKMFSLCDIDEIFEKIGDSTVGSLPAEWSEDTIRKAIEEVGLTQHQINWFKNNVFPPKQEWSEEDKKNFGEAISYIKDDSLRDFLKSLPERFNLQPKQESEPIEIKYAGKIYKVYGTKELPGGVVGYIIEDEPGHYDCIIHPDEVLGGGYGIKSNGSPYPTKEITSDEKSVEYIEDSAHLGSSVTTNGSEWSEEDEYTLGDAITAVDMMLTDSFQDSHPNLFKALLIAKDFLKSLPERFNLPPKQEWNEEDKHKLQQAINTLDNCGYTVLVNWFKSLPERFNLQPNWKPSEEQMWALDVALENFYHKDDRAALESLRTDLKNYFSHEIH